MRPRLSVIVRSYNRLGALAELLKELLAQDHDDFEIVVVDQSTVRPEAELAVVESLAKDPRVRLLRFPPLGGPGARNAGVRAARGDLFVCIDDDTADGGSVSVLGVHMPVVVRTGVQDLLSWDDEQPRNQSRALDDGQSGGMRQGGVDWSLCRIVSLCHE